MDNTQLGKSFEQIGPAYDEVRPGYPESVYDRIVAFSSLLAPSRILEVGTGTGKATLPFAKRGFQIQSLEPGQRLSNIARANLSNFPAVTIDTTSFEEWTNAAQDFKLVFCAQAYHWLDPQKRIERFALAND
jgi:protein-L-isoaspartate O-methyltransferase